MYEMTGVSKTLSGNAITSSNRYDDSKPPVNKTIGFFKMLREGRPLPITHWERRFYESSGQCFIRGTRTRLSNGERQTEGARSDPAVSFSSASFPSLPAATLNSMRNRLLIEATSRAKNAAWDIGTFLAESNKTYSLVRHAHSRTRARALDILSARGPGRVVRTAAEFASAWLEYRYGWRILMYDLESAQDSIERLRSSKFSLDRNTTHDHWSSTSQDGGGGFTLPSAGHTIGTRNFTPGCGKVTKNFTWTTHLDLRVGCGVEATDSRAFSINPIVTGWELTPFSFVIDWFVDVGSILGAFTPTYGRRVAYQWCSEKWTRSISQSYSHTTNPDNNSYLYTFEGGGVSRAREIRYIRYPVSGPTFSVDFNPRLTLPRWADLVALAVTLNGDVLKRIAGRR